MVGSTLALCLYEQRHVCDIVAVPSLEGLQFLQSFAGRTYHHLHISISIGWRKESLILYGKALWWEDVARWFVESHLLSVPVGQAVCGRIEVESA